MSGERRDASTWATELGVSREAAEIVIASDVIDLHVDTFIWTRIFGYSIARRHGTGPFGARFLGQADLPRLVEGGVTGATWVVTTNPFRTARGRERAFFANLERITADLAASGMAAIARNVAEYRDARSRGIHAAFVGVQGANALDHDLSAWERIPGGLVSRATLVHLTSSSLGGTSSPLRLGRRDAGLTPRGHELVERLDALRIFVDLAHVSRRGFRDAVLVHDRSLPLVVTHTGVTGAHDHWRNLDDDQIRAIAGSGGTIGIMYQTSFLGGGLLSGGAELVVRHLEHVIRVAGEDHASLGSDWDGMIVTPRDMPTCLELPRLVDLLLQRGHSAERIGKILGGNYLRALTALRG